MMIIHELPSREEFSMLEILFILGLRDMENHCNKALLKNLNKLGKTLDAIPKAYVTTEKYIGLYKN